jgi:hypothetical protein
MKQMRNLMSRKLSSMSNSKARLAGNPKLTIFPLTQYLLTRATGLNSF